MANEPLDFHPQSADSTGEKGLLGQNKDGHMYI
jgi:hypothetical protein